MRMVQTARGAYGFCEEVKKEKMAAFVTEKVIRESLPDEELQTLEKMVAEKERELTANHRERMTKVQASLSGADRARVEKVADLLARLNESEGEYVRFRLMSEIEMSKEE